MPVSEGKFQLYRQIRPALEAGDWKLVGKQKLSGTASTGPLTEADLDVETADINFRIRSPRYVMPPDQVLSTYPPANSFGSYGSRLPQVVIKRRTLPWERRLDDAPETTPWLALVLIAEGEAALETGVDVANCITEGVVLDGIADVEKGNCLAIRKSVIDKVFPTQNDVELLAHAREVDISDTELLMGDDDGFLSVVVSNRLPVPGVDDDGKDAPIKYLACLVNLEGQFNRLLERSPDPEPFYVTDLLDTSILYVSDTSTDDHLTMGTAASPVRSYNAADLPGVGLDDIEILGNSDSNSRSPGSSGPTPRAVIDGGSSSLSTRSGVSSTSGAAPLATDSSWSTVAAVNPSSTEIGLQMATDFRIVESTTNVRVDPEYRFPVLMHWSFTTQGSTTFRSLMEGLDSRLLGDAGDETTTLDGRLPLEVVESGHVGLGHQTRDGDNVRAWYRGPLTPHPTSTNQSRLPLAHSSDQLRVVIPDGREDLSLAAAFEVGRLLSLSQPSIIGALLRWRQGKYHAARLASLVEPNRKFWEKVFKGSFELDDIAGNFLGTGLGLGPLAGRYMARGVVANPEQFLGQPRPVVTPGRPLAVDGLPTDLLATGLGLDPSTLKGDIGTIFGSLRDIDVPAFDLKLDELGAVGIREQLEVSLDLQRIDIVSNTLANRFITDGLRGPAFPIINDPVGFVVPDALDALISNENQHENDIQEDEE